MDHNCNICNKKYSSYQSLWIHNKRFHNNNIKKVVNNGDKKCKTNKSVTCEFCNKIFNNRPAKSLHKKKCNHDINTSTPNKIIIKTKNNIEDKILKYDEKLLKYDEKNKELEKMINEMKKQFSLILKEKGTMHPKTLQKINNQLNNINNGNIINNTYVKFGEIDYEKILNSDQIKQILNKQYKCLEESIKQIHFNNNLPEYNNVFITNMKDDIAYIFDGNNFISVRKNEMINDLIDLHTKEINLSLEKNKNKLNEKYVTRLEDFINKLNDKNTKFTDHNNQRIYSSYKAYKTNSIKLLLYNESDKKKLDILSNMELKEKIYDDLVDSDVD